MGRRRPPAWRYASNDRETLRARAAAPGTGVVRGPGAGRSGCTAGYAARPRDRVGRNCLGCAICGLPRSAISPRPARSPAPPSVPSPASSRGRSLIATSSSSRTAMATRTGAPPAWTSPLRTTLGSILTWARHPRRRYLAHNPMDGLERLRLPRAKSARTFSPRKSSNCSAWRPRCRRTTPSLRRCYFRGLRRGESSHSNGRTSSRATGRVGDSACGAPCSRAWSRTPKTEGSDRVLDIPQRLLDELAIYRLAYPPIGPEEYIFRQASERPWIRTRGIGRTSCRCSSAPISASQGPGCIR